MTRGGYEFSRASEYNCLMDGKCGPNALAAEPFFPNQKLALVHTWTRDTSMMIDSIDHKALWQGALKDIGNQVVFKLS